MSLGYVDLPIQGEDLDARPVPKCYLAMWKKSGKKNLFPRTLTAGLSGSVACSLQHLFVHAWPRRDSLRFLAFLDEARFPPGCLGALLWGVSLDWIHPCVCPPTGPRTQAAAGRSGGVPGLLPGHRPATLDKIEGSSCQDKRRIEP